MCTYVYVFCFAEPMMMITKPTASCVLCDSSELIKIHTQYLLGNFFTFFFWSRSCSFPFLPFSLPYANFFEHITILNCLESLNSLKNMYTGYWMLVVGLLRNRIVEKDLKWKWKKKTKQKIQFGSIPNVKREKKGGRVRVSSLFICDAKIIRIIDRLVHKIFAFISSLVAIPRNCWPSLRSHVVFLLNLFQFIPHRTL